MKLCILIPLLSVGLGTCWAGVIVAMDGDTYENNESCHSDLRKLWFELIVPGTKWCGIGDIADTPEHLGYFAETDACCRTHDYCEDVIPAKETKYNLTNRAIYSRLHCSCDEQFFDCLHKSEDGAGPYVGRMYFTALNTKCFREDYPIVGCRRTSMWWRPKRCLEYILDLSKPKIYQWFDVPYY